MIEVTKKHKELTTSHDAVQKLLQAKTEEIQYLQNSQASIADELKHIQENPRPAPALGGGGGGGGDPPAEVLSSMSGGWNRMGNGNGGGGE